MSRITVRKLVAMGVLITLWCLKRSLDVLPRWHGFTGDKAEPTNVPTLSSVESYVADGRPNQVAHTQSSDSPVAEKTVSKMPGTALGGSPTDSTSMNKGFEANPYLTYIVDHYEFLPSPMAFIHRHESGFPRAWHTDALDYSNVHALRSLNVKFVQRNGYANLRCIHIPGCPDEIQPFREPYDAGRTIEHIFPAVWETLFNDTDVPAMVGAPCCAQFAVSREQVRKRPREFYGHALQFLRDTALEDDASGRVFEYLWHIIFGQDAVYCPPLEQCYRDVYGR